MPIIVRHHAPATLLLGLALWLGCRALMTVQIDILRGVLTLAAGIAGWQRAARPPHTPKPI